MVLLFSAASQQYNSAPAQESKTKSDAPIKFPENYRQWVYLTTGFDMSYNPAMSMDHHMFDNVFVNPEAYKAFVETGTWPDKTVLVLEVRGGKSKGSINKQGNYQDTEVMGLEIHMKDEARFPGKWAFVGFDDNKVAKVVPTSASCYTSADRQEQRHPVCFVPKRHCRRASEVSVRRLGNQNGPLLENIED
jgi:hypothetical protein